MTAEIDLTTASREELLALVASQQATIAALQHRVEELEARVAGCGRARGMPGNKMASRRAARGGGKPERRRRQGFGQTRWSPPTGSSTRWPVAGTTAWRSPAGGITAAAS